MDAAGQRIAALARWVDPATALADLPAGARLDDVLDALAVTWSAARLPSHTTTGATCSIAHGSISSPSGGGGNVASVIAVRARGASALARTPYLPQPCATVNVSAAMPPFAAE